MRGSTGITFIAVALTALQITLVGTAQCEIYQCDGKWTNKPCSGAIERTMHESAEVVVDAGGEPVEAEEKEEAAKPGDIVLEPLAPRYALARKLRKTSRDFSLKHGISLTKEQLSDFDERCTKRETPFAQCQAQFDGYVQKLNAQLQQKQKK
jgi:hypothetical protein